MPATQRITGGYQEDWDSGDAWMNGGEAATLATGIEIPNVTEILADVEVELIVDDIIGAPILSVPIVTRTAGGQVQVDFQNEAAAGNQCKWTAKVEWRHSAGR